MVLIPFEEYERLIEAAEDAVDVRVASEIKRLLATGEEELIPPKLLTEWSTAKTSFASGVNIAACPQKELAEATGLAAPYISQLETGKREGTIETFKKIAAALRVDIDDIA
jgi:DNA-binding XRE family transcriptional regulator